MSAKFNKKLLPAGGVRYPIAQPEIYYRLQPFIDQACDEWERQGVRKPTAEQVAQACDRIYDGAAKRYPDLARQAGEYEKSLGKTATEAVELFGIRIQQAGLFGDLIAFLLLAELFRRRRFRRGRY